MYARKLITINGKKVEVGVSLHRRPNKPGYRPNAILKGGVVFLPFVTANLTTDQRRGA